MGMYSDRMCYSCTFHLGVGVLVLCVPVIMTLFAYFTYHIYLYAPSHLPRFLAHFLKKKMGKNQEMISDQTIFLL